MLDAGYSCNNDKSFIFHERILKNEVDSSIMTKRITKEIIGIIKNLDRANISFEDKRVLITGGAGFLGSWICDVLVSQDARVTCIDNFASGHPDNIAGLLGDENFSFIRHDISTPINLEEHLDLVIHMASRASPLEFAKYPIQILKANTLGIWVALGIAKKHRSRFLYTSSSEIYGDPTPENIPTPETYNGNVNPIGPRGCYDEAKRCGEAFVSAYYTEHGLDTRIVRIFNTYGPKMRSGDIYGRVVSRFVDQALHKQPITIFGEGTQTRSFLYVTDQVTGLLKVAHSPESTGTVVNIGSDREIQIIELAAMIKEITGSQSALEFYPLPPDDPKRRCPDIQRAKNLLKWRPTVNLREGLEETINWFENQMRTTEPKSS